MSLLKRLVKNVGRGLSKIGPIAQMIPHPIARGVGMLGSIASASRSSGAGMAPAPITTGSMMFPALPSIGQAIGRTLPAVGRIAGGAVGVAAAGARAITRSAMSYCRKHPQWCATVGGVAAVEAMISRGELPPVKRSRGRGITPRELRSFKRVSRVLSRYCAPTKRAMRAPALRGGKSCR